MSVSVLMSTQDQSTNAVGWREKMGNTPLQVAHEGQEP